MSMHSATRWYAIATLAVLVTPASAQLVWNLAPLVPGSDTVSVIISTIKLPKDDVLQSADVQMVFTDTQNKGTGVPYRLIAAGDGVPAGIVVQFDIRHGRTNLARVDAKSLAWSSHLLGTKGDGLSGSPTTVRGPTAQPTLRRQVAQAHGGAHYNVTQAGLAHERSCRAYAALAQAQQEVNAGQNCGFPASGRWDADFSVHYEWCKTRGIGNLALATAEAATRARMLVEQCAR
jgi:hypothetical protein